MLGTICFHLSFIQVYLYNVIKIVYKDHIPAPNDIVQVSGEVFAVDTIEVLHQC